MCNRENEINQTKRYKCHQHTGQAEFLRKTQLQIVDIEIMRQIMAMRKNISVETGKVCVGVRFCHVRPRGFSATIMEKIYQATL